MNIAGKYDNITTGIISGTLLPVIIGLSIFLFTSGGIGLPAYLERIRDANIITHAISICVFPNVIIFLLFNRFDMLRAARGVLAMTIVFAILVFLIRLI